MRFFGCEFGGGVVGYEWTGAAAIKAERIKRDVWEGIVEMVGG